MISRQTTDRARPAGTPRRRPARSRFGAFQRAVARALLVAFVWTGAAGPVAADPTQTALGPAETTYGSGEFTVNTPTQTEYTQHSQQVIVDWGVDIQQGPDHTLGFRQEQGFTVLNRSPGVAASNFYGTVECDATCIFANEAGIYFHDGSFVDVGQLIAAAGTISTGDFASGQYLFSDVLGEVVNYGQMRGDAITLLGQRVANFGYVETPGGSFAMLAGNGILLRDHDSPIVIESPLPPPRAEGSGFDDTPAVENAGVIDATDGSVRLAAGDMLSFAIRQSGEIRARQVALEGGADGLVEVSGTIDASDARSGHTGGQIDVLGDYVAVVDDALLDASGSAGGGRVHVGGDRRGEGALRTARGTYVHPDATIRADALDAGDGGEVIVFAQDTAQVYGTLSARGGTEGGDGGFVETSGKRSIDVRRAPEVHARSGLAGDRAGEWLIDPNDIEIVSTEALCGGKPACLDGALSDESLRNPIFAQSGPVVRPTVNDSKITADVIARALETGSNVTIVTETAASTPGTQEGNITVSSEIVVHEDQGPGPGTEVTLALLAAQDITIDQAIRVERRASSGTNEPRSASDLALSMFLLAGDGNQVQAPAAAGQPGNNYFGAIDVRADLDTAGGNLTLQGLGITVGPQATVKTNGGAVNAQSNVGDIVLRGVVDTSSDVFDEVTDSVLLGGDVTLRAAAVRRPETSGTTSPTFPVGGNVVIENHVLTGGGRLDVTGQGGDVTFGGGPTRATIATLGGDVVLRALEQTLGAVTSADVPETVGGRITIADNGRILSGGGAVDVGVADVNTFLPGAREIVMQGEIDTRTVDRDSLTTLGPDALTADLVDDAAAGGPVFFNTVGENASVLIAPGATGSPSIVTNGAGFDSVGDGTFTLVDGRIDTTFQGTIRPADLVLDSSIDIQHDDRVEILETAGATTELLTEESILVRSGLGAGIGDLVFGDADHTGDPLLQADTITLSAGDGEAPGGTGTDAQVLLGNVLVTGFTNASPEAFILEQDADLDANGVLGSLPGGFTGLERLTLSAWDGVIRIPSPDALVIKDVDLSLNAGSGVEVDAGYTPPAPGPLPADKLASLDIEIVERFRLEQSLADWLSVAARKVRVGAGGTTADDTPSLTIVGSSDALSPMRLAADESLTLQAGLRGFGDLAFEGQTLLGAPDITLQAGNGDAAGTSAVRTAGLSGVTFEDGAGGQLDAFTLRQDAAITPDAIPADSRFTGGVGGVRYTLRADAPGSGITLDGTSPARLLDTDLRLFANGSIDLSALADDELAVRSLDVGGIGSFQYTSALDDKFSFTGNATRALVIRAGLGGTGILSFGGDLVIEADTVRLVAGDGVGGGGSNGPDGGSIRLAPLSGAAPKFRKNEFTGLDEFVFRQDLDIDAFVLPDLVTHFDGKAPGRLGIRSDDGAITFADLSGTGPLLEAGSQIVLSAPTITLSRTDGENLVLDAVFGDGAGGPPGSVELRADVVRLTAAVPESDGTKTPVVRPGGNTRYMAFDRPADLQLLDSPPVALVFDAQSPEAPASLAAAPDAIFITQDGDIAGDPDPSLTNLIDTALLGPSAGSAKLNEYTLTSNFGSVTVTPGDVDDQTDLVLILDGLQEIAALGPRRVSFLDDANAGFSLNSLVVETPFGLTVENASTTESRLDIRATNFIGLLAGLGNAEPPGSGNLDFAGDVRLRSSTIVLQAGDDPEQPIRTTDVPAQPSAVVDTRNATFYFDDQKDPMDPNDPGVPTGLRILQHGRFTDAATADPTLGESRIVLRDRILGTDDLPTVLDSLQLVSFFSDIDIADFKDGVSVLPAKSVTLVAGSTAFADGTIRLARPDGDLDLSVYADGQKVFEELGLIAPHIELSAGATGTSVVRARGTNVLLLGSSFFTSPESLRVAQDGDFLEAGQVTDCTFGCLPETFQLGSSLASGLDYTLESRAGQIYVNEPLSLKVWGSDLTLLADNTADSGQPDVLFDLRTNRTLDLFLASLTVGDAAANDTEVLLRADGSGANDPVDPNGGVDDAFGDLTIVTAGTQTWNGPVTLDGRIELTGDVVELASTLNESTSPATLKVVDSSGPASTVVTGAPAASGESDLTLGVVTEGRLVGDIGTLAQPIDRLRVNFAPTTFPASAVRFGTLAGGSATDVYADLIEFFAVSNAANDVKTARSPLTSTIYKRNGDLTFHADTFTMGVGEKLTVQGKLAIHVATQATLGDLSALEIQVGPPQPGPPQPGDPQPTIALQRRPAGSYLARNGSVRPDGGVDYVANTIAFDGRIVVTGAGRNPVFGIADPRSAPAFMNGFPVLAAQASGRAFDASQIDSIFSRALPDLHPEGASRDDVTEMYFADRLVPQPPAWEPAIWLPWQRSALTNLFVFARPLDRRERSAWLGGAPLIDDVGRNLQAWDGRPMPVAAARLDGADAKRAVDLFEHIFGADGGNVDMLKRTLQRAVDEYVRNTGARRVVGFELRRYVKNRPSSLYQAYQLLEDLDALFAYHRGLGLTPGEYRPIQARWLDAIRPDGITTQELAEAVQPSRYVRGTDVLDIFGD